MAGLAEREHGARVRLTVFVFLIQDEGLQIENSELIERLLVLIAAQCDFAEAFRVRNDRFQISRDHQARAVSIDTGDAIVKPARTERSRRCVVGDCPELVDFRSGDQDVAIDPDINLLAELVGSGVWSGLSIHLTAGAFLAVPPSFLTSLSKNA